MSTAFKFPIGDHIRFICDEDSDDDDSERENQNLRTAEILRYVPRTNSIQVKEELNDGNFEINCRFCR